MSKAGKHSDQFLAELEALMLYIVNLKSPHEGWALGSDTADISSIEEWMRTRWTEVEAQEKGEPLPTKTPVGPTGWTPEEYKRFTAELKQQTIKHWPELWQPQPGEANRGIDIETRAWEIIRTLRRYLQHFWRASEDKKARAQDWHIHRAREYHQRLRILPELLKVDARVLATVRDAKLDEPPTPSNIEEALYHLQQRATKAGRRPRICDAENCERPYFLPTSPKGQTYCPECQRSQPARNRVSKRSSYHSNKNRWPSTAKRKKHA